MTEPMALYHYFQRETSLPYHKGSLSNSVSPASIRDFQNPEVVFRGMGVVFS